EIFGVEVCTLFGVSARSSLERRGQMDQNWRHSKRRSQAALQHDQRQAGAGCKGACLNSILLLCLKMMRVEIFDNRPSRNKEGKQAVNMTRLSCHRFRPNEVRLMLS